MYYIYIFTPQISKCLHGIMIVVNAPVAAWRQDVWPAKQLGGEGREAILPVKKGRAKNLTLSQGTS